MKKVKVWTENLEIPTYLLGEPEKNPIFIEKRVYQGSSGKVYPYPVIEKIHDQKVNKQWKAVCLENDFIKIIILPEIGGRIQMAYDKTKQRHFVYYNEVIKPALIGLTGPWISGGIEFNWPQHHRPTTYDPVDFTIGKFDDGSATIWCSELERMFRTKGMTGFTLYPDKSYLEIKVKLYNNTSLPQTFLWWANPAVKVNDHYQSVFPPDVNAVFDHGKRDVSPFPVATGTYKKVDYSPGTDISKYKNIPVPTSYMVASSKYDFVGGYEHDTNGGILHVANHHISPGKKQWTWGNGEFGRAWYRNLADGDEAYIELMCGVYTDNQPDFSWLMPHEEKSFKQYFLPYRDVGVVKNATKDALVNLEIVEDEIEIKVYTTAVYPDCRVILKSGNTVIFEDFYQASPHDSYIIQVEIPGASQIKELLVEVSDSKENILVSWKKEKPGQFDIPEPAKAALDPGNIESIEELFLTGQHLEQYRHATFNPADYYKEALKRSPGDTRSNNALGLLYLKIAKFDLAEKYFRKAIKSITKYNPNPYDSEPFFNLGLTLKYLGRHDEAYDYLYKSTWNVAWKNPGFFHIAQLDLINGKPEEALNHINISLSNNTNDHKARHLKIIILRKLGKVDEALNLSKESLALDRFNYGALYERYLLTVRNEDLSQFSHIIRQNIHNYIEYSLDYASAGLFKEAMKLLEAGLNESTVKYPLAYYYLGWFAQLNEEPGKAKAYFTEGSRQKPDYCFPHQVESVIALQAGIRVHPSDAKGYYYLGNFWYNAKQYTEAVKNWGLSAGHDDKFPTTYRNLALAYYNKLGKTEKALNLLEKAFTLDQTDSRVFMELCQLYKQLNKDIDFRIDMLEKHPELVDQRDDVYLEKVTLYNLLGKHDRANDLIYERNFHPWEGGEGKVSNQFVISLVEMSKNLIQDGKYYKAIELLNKSREFPVNLGEGRLFGAQENEIDYWMAIALQRAGDANGAHSYLEKASRVVGELGLAMFYDDQPPENLFYKGLALKVLNKNDEAEKIFKNLVNHGETHKNDHIKIDYFAISLPDLMIWEKDLDVLNSLHCKYIVGLGLMGLGKMEEANTEFAEVLDQDKSHMGARVHQKMIRQNIGIMKTH